MRPRFRRKCPRKRAFMQRGNIRRALLFIVAALVLGVGLYSLAGFYGGPWLVDRWLAEYRAAAPGRSASRESVRFDPFRLVAEIDALEISEAEGGAAFAADRLVVVFAAQSLIELRPVARSIVIESPRIALPSVADLEAIVRGVRDTILSQARIDFLDLVGGRFTAGLGTDRPLEAARVDLSLTGFDRRSGAAAPFSLEILTADDASLSSEGSLASSLERADGQLRLGAVELRNVVAWLDSAVGAVDAHGRIDLSAAFAATGLLAAPKIVLSNGSFEWSEPSLRPSMGLTVTADRVAGAAALELAATEDGIEVSGRIEVDDARFSAVDSRANPPQTFGIENAAVLATADSGGDGLSLSLEGRVRNAGATALTVRVPAQDSGPRRVTLEADGLPAALVSTYAFDALGRRLSAGNADVRLEYTLNRARIAGSLHLVGRELEFATLTPEAVFNRTAPSLELAAALLENSDGVIDIDLPFASNSGTVRDAAAAALKVRLAVVTATPFETLAPLLSDAGDTASAVPFLAGEAALNDRALASISRLAEALNARPRLGLRVHGGYDPSIDRDALAKRQIELHVQLATADPSLQAQPMPVDFGSERVWDVLDEFAGERLPAERIADLAERFNCEGALAAVCKRAYYELVFDALVANEDITPTALNRLGRFRAQSIIDALRQQGIDGERLAITTGSDIVETAFGVGVPIELTATDQAP